MSKFILRNLFFSMVFAVVYPAPVSWGHEISDSVMTMAAETNTLSGEWRVSAAELDIALIIDNDDDDLISDRELAASSAIVTGYMASAVTVQRADDICQTSVQNPRLMQDQDDQLVVANLNVTCSTSKGSTKISYALFQNFNPIHRGLIKLQGNGEEQVLSVSNDGKFAELNIVEGVSAWTQFKRFVAEGIWHIWIGFDHIVFLIVLLLPAVLMQRDENDTLGAVMVRVAKVITAFTVAHSITLGLVTFGWLSIPAWIVESTIAFSVVVAAANNVWNFMSGRDWVLALVFGLIHGAGFANVLAPLGLTPGMVGLSLAGFNIGVEIGQLAIIVVLVPVFYALRTTNFYYRFGLVGGSATAACIGCLWIVDRVSGLGFMPF